MESRKDKDEKRPRIELFTKGSYRFCSNPLKDEVTTAVIVTIFVLMAIIIGVNIIRGML